MRTGETGGEGWRHVLERVTPFLSGLRALSANDHGNTRLHLHDALTVLLAAFFDTAVRSQRLIEHFSLHEGRALGLGVPAVRRSTLSDALRRFDPAALEPLIRALVPRAVARGGALGADLAGVTRRLIAADGSYFNLAGEAAWALLNRRGRGDARQYRARLNLQLDVTHLLPVDADVSGGDDGSEPAAFVRRLAPDAIYVVDRNFVHFGFINAVFEAGSNLVLRLKRSTCFEVERAAERTDLDRQRGVLRDEVGTLSGPRSAGNEGRKSRTAAPPTRRLRRVTLWDERNGCEVTLLTDLMDVPAHVVGTIYRLRWQIELFLRWLKVHAATEHLLSKSARGVTLQFYVAIVGTLLLHLHFGRVGKYELAWMRWVAAGRMPLDAVPDLMERVERQRAGDRARHARRRHGNAGVAKTA